MSSNFDENQNYAYVRNQNQDQQKCYRQRPPRTYHQDRNRMLPTSQTQHSRWILWTIWDPVISEILSTIKDVGYIPISKSNFFQLFNACIWKFCKSYRGIQEGCIVVLIKPTDFQQCTNRIIHTGDSFIYNWTSHRIEINVQLIPLLAQKLNEKTDRSPKTLLAFGMLAQFLAAKAEVNDLFIISGKGFSQKRTEINLNRNNLGDVDSIDNWLDVIQFHLDVNKWDEESRRINMIEKIRHHEVQDRFQFKYSACKYSQKGRHSSRYEMGLVRSFNLSDYLDCDKHDSKPFKTPISGDPTHALRVYNAMIYANLGVLNYSNQRTRKGLQKPIPVFLVRENVSLSLLVKLMICAGILISLPLLLCYQSDPLLIDFLCQFTEIMEIN